MAKRLCLSLVALFSAVAQASSVRDAITFDGEPKALYAPAREVATGLGLGLRYDSDSDLAFLESIVLDHTLQSPSGERWVRLGDLRRIGVAVYFADDGVSLAYRGKGLAYRKGLKRVEVDKAAQRLKAFQGGRLVVESAVSTGRYEGSTPIGAFRAGLKDAYHASSLYEDAPMPWAVQVVGNVFVHGYRIVPSQPASRGCVRMPIRSAEWFFRWVEPGTPIKISGKWRGVGRLRT